MKRIDGDGAGRIRLLLVDDHPAADNIDRLVRVPGREDGNPVDRQAADVRAADGGATQDRKGPRHNEISGYSDPGHAQAQISERGFGAHLSGVTHRGGLKDTYAEQGGNVA